MTVPIRNNPSESVAGADETHAAGDRGAAGVVAVFVDLDTVLLATHMGKYGPELALQSGLDEPLERLAESAGALVILVNPPEPDSPRSVDTGNRLRALRAGLGLRMQRLIVATCSHGEDGRCGCAKPGTGLIDQVMAEHALKAEGGWYICGDQPGVVSGRTAGLKTVRLGPAGEDRLSSIHRPDYEARDLLDASNHIMFEVS